jgi:hypothetical protein
VRVFAALWGKDDATGGDPPAVPLIPGPAIVNRHDLAFASTPSELSDRRPHVALPAAGHLPCRFHPIVLRDAATPPKFQNGRRFGR